MRRILITKGGGVRGSYTTSRFLKPMERQLGKPLREVFDMFGGTSTGALISAALAVGLPAERIQNIYVDRAPHDIFTNQRTAGFRQLTEGHAYSQASISKVLLSEFGRDYTLNELPVRVALTARWVGGENRIFVKDNPKNSGKTGGCSLIQCATASAAAPWYFDATYVNPTGGTLMGWCYDGGIGGDANPTYDVCEQAFDFDDFDPAGTMVIVLGTGFYKETADVNKPAGPLGVISFCINSLLDAAEDFQTRVAKRCWPDLIQTFDGDLGKAIDMADTSAIPDLIKLGESAPEDDWVKILKL